MQQAVKAAFVDEHGGPLAHPGLGMVGHGKAGGGHHFKIIGAVAYNLYHKIVPNLRGS